MIVEYAGVVAFEVLSRRGVGDDVAVGPRIPQDGGRDSVGRMAVSRPTKSDAAVRAPRTRMTAPQRRAQLIEVRAGLFAERGFEGTSIEEIAQRASVSKPIVYEHFGGKEGLYAVVVDREMETLLGWSPASLSRNSSLHRIQSVALALLTWRNAPTGSAS